MNYELGFVFDYLSIVTLKNQQEAERFKSK